MLCITLAAAAILLGRQGGAQARVGRAARLLAQIANAKSIYSAVFVLSAIEWRPILDILFWRIIAAWVVILLLGIVNWQAIWSTAIGRASPCRIEGNVGPSILLISAPQLPPAGSFVSLDSPKLSAEGVILNRIRRSDDDWAEVHVLDPNNWDALITRPPAKISIVSESRQSFVGSVDVGSTDRSLRFISTKRLEVSQVVAVVGAGSQPPVIYQIVGAKIERADVKGGGHLVTRAEAVQLGIFDTQSLRFSRDRWVPTPGASVVEVPEAALTPVAPPPQNWLLLGHVIGTRVPVYIDVIAACEGHLAILGMTKMGKTTLAFRLAKALADSRSVTILDQTGEYVNRRKLPETNNDTDFDHPGLSVFEPQPGKVPADRALDCLQFILKRATEEYKNGEPFPRTLVIDEAHQFIPEPAGIGFNAPGRESSFTIGLLMMQIRKYGISVFLISQRTAVVAKSALSQCENLIAFRSVDQTGLDYLEAVAGTDVRSLLPQLKHGEALVFGPAISSETPVAICVVR